MSAGKFIGAGVAACLLFGAYCGYSSNKYIQPYNNVKGSIGQVQNVEDISWRQTMQLGNTVASYAQHEKETYVGVAQGRGGVSGNVGANLQVPKKPEALNASPEEVMRNPKLREQLDTANTTMTNYVNAAVEAYPQLKADGLYSRLMTTIEGSNNRISTERRRQIEYTKVYNVAIQQFPQNLVAKLTGYTEIPYYSAPAGHEDAAMPFQK